MERDRDRERQREREIETERDRDREGERETHTHMHMNTIYDFLNVKTIYFVMLFSTNLRNISVTFVF